MECTALAFYRGTLMMRAVLIGLGNIAWRFDDRASAVYPASQGGAMLRHPGVRLAGGCSPDAGDRQGFTAWSGGLPAYETLDEMLASLQPDLVGVCSPTPLHFEHVSRCLRAGVRSIWLEKAPAATLAQVDQLIGQAQACRATVCVNYTRRYAENYAQLKAAYKSGRYGACRTVNILYSPGLVRNGVHFLDLLFYLTDAADFRLHAVMRNGDSPHFMLELDNGVHAVVTGGGLPYHSNTLSLVCEGGILTAANGGARIAIEGKVENPAFPGFYALKDVTACEAVSDGMGDYMGRALGDLVACSATQTEPRSTLATARVTQRLVDEVLA